jgi:hypothetical protein
VLKRSNRHVLAKRAYVGSNPIPPSIKSGTVDSKHQCVIQRNGKTRGLTHSIAGSIMNKKKIAKLRRELKQLRDAKYSLKRSDLTGFAGKVGRKEDTSRGKEPTYVSVFFPELRPLSIPGHREVNPFTANSILDTLEADLDKLEAWVDEQEAKAKNENAKGLPPTTVRSDSDPSGPDELSRGDS